MTISHKLYSLCWTYSSFYQTILRKSLFDKIFTKALGWNFNSGWNFFELEYGWKKYACLESSQPSSTYGLFDFVHISRNETQWQKNQRQFSLCRQKIYAFPRKCFLFTFREWCHLSTFNMTNVKKVKSIRSPRKSAGVECRSQSKIFLSDVISVNFIHFKRNEQNYEHPRILHNTVGAWNCWKWNSRFYFYYYNYKPFYAFDRFKLRDVYFSLWGNLVVNSYLRFQATDLHNIGLIWKMPVRSVC
jgi:hypothetical protein